MSSFESGVAPGLEGCVRGSTHSTKNFAQSGSCYCLLIYVYYTNCFCYISALAETYLSKDPFFMLELAVHKETFGGKSYFHYTSLMKHFWRDIVVLHLLTFLR